MIYDYTPEPREEELADVRAETRRHKSPYHNTKAPFTPLRNLTTVKKKRTYHVYPVHEEHVLDGMRCPCKPAVRFNEKHKTQTIVHNDLRR